MDDYAGKRHCDCNWLIENNEEGGCFCCDSRRENKGKKLLLQDIEKEACPFFHSKIKKNKQGVENEERTYCHVSGNDSNGNFGC